MPDAPTPNATPSSDEFDAVESDAPYRPRHQRAIRVGSFGIIVAIVFGLLLWARFVIITGHPRTAIAEPPAAAAPGAPLHAAPGAAPAHAGVPTP